VCVYALHINSLSSPAPQTIESDSTLVEFIKSASEDLYLKRACPGSHFGAVFAQASLGGYLLPGASH
jgi:hypothetical protein